MSWLQNTFRGLLFKNVAFNLTIQEELYFEESEIESFVKKLEEKYPETEYVNRLMTHSWGQKVVRFYDPDGNLIEVGTPV